MINNKINIKVGKNRKGIKRSLTILIQKQMYFPLFHVVFNDSYPKTYVFSFVSCGTVFNFSYGIQNFKNISVYPSP